jgi:hypothetical protein
MDPNRPICTNFLVHYTLWSIRWRQHLSPKTVATKPMPTLCNNHWTEFASIIMWLEIYKKEDHKNSVSPHEDNRNRLLYKWSTDRRKEWISIKYNRTILTVIPATTVVCPLLAKKRMMALTVMSQYKIKELFLESKGFWQWCIKLRITEFLNFVHHPEFWVLENTTLQKLDLFPSLPKWFWITFAI